MRKFRFTIGNRIIAGFLALILIFSINAVVTLVTVNSNDTVVNISNNILSPSVSLLKEFNTQVIRNQMLVTNWVYLQSDEKGKDALKDLHNEGFPELREQLQLKMEMWDDSVNQDRTLWVLYSMDSLLARERSEIMERLVEFEDYQDPITKFTAEEEIDGFVLPTTSAILDSLALVIAEKQEEDESIKEEINANSNRLSNITLILGTIILIAGIIVSILMARSITRPIISIKAVIQKLGAGELPEEGENRTTSNDEIGEMSMAVENLVVGLRSTSLFAENIGNGRYDADFNPLSDKDVLGNALIEMRDNLKKVAEEDKRRNWATEGIAKFGEILRKNNDNLERLADEIISNLIKYMGANQGGLYIIQQEEGDDDFMTLMACYAWDKKKYLDQKIYIGDGLTGQSWLEKDTIYLTEVPNDYVSITSGLGEANPRSILIVPLKVNEDIFGVIEVASFKEFASFEIEFVERIAESIASTISSVRITERTQNLLEESTNMTEMMRAQEEEMRQNMEELQATQEEMERSQRETEDKERIITATSLLFELSKTFSILSTNDLLPTYLGYTEGELNGKSFETLCVSSEAMITMRQSISEGKPWSGSLALYNSEQTAVNFWVAAGQTNDLSSGTEKYLLFASRTS